MYQFYIEEVNLKIISLITNDSCFLTKGYIYWLAHELQVLHYTIYNHLKELKAKK